MTNCEHLIENALIAMKKARSAGKDTYKAFHYEMSIYPNNDMLQRVNITIDELWEIAQYIVFTWEG